MYIVIIGFNTTDLVCHIFNATYDCHRAFAALYAADRLAALAAPTRVASRFEADPFLGLRGDLNAAPGEPGAWGVRAPLAALDVCDCLLQLGSDRERITLLMALPVESSAAAIAELRLRGECVRMPLPTPCAVRTPPHAPLASQSPPALPHPRGQAASVIFCLS
jgi:hypothetical protein